VDNKVWQEFYCNDCPDGGYFRVKLNMAINARVEMCCPNCGRKHPRVIKDGVIYENADLGANAWKEEIVVPKSAWSKESRHNGMMIGARDGKVFNFATDYKGDPLLKERWLELYGGDGNND